MNVPAPHSTLTKLLHLLIAAALIHQLFISLIMVVPETNRPGDSYFELHEWVGVLTLWLLVIFWIWTLVRRGETRFAMLFPWFSATRRSAFWADLKAHLASLARGGGPLTEESPLASAVHGLGLLIATAMALTGAVGYFFPAASLLLEVHMTIAPVMWAYLTGHVGVALLHQMAGHRILQRMFGSGRNGNAQPDR
ncbi:cytochrome b/b6 domain-containing protein [Sphingobium xenophagum]|uniref:cytochrome b/b6 domain-containing protein n=1 Tax=Sphingobium xenophagum TaxID=121428 RepID=UPI000561278B|nr:cytochrome b/b6 domain-containing protein [Sphingobium xenophagum]